MKVVLLHNEKAGEKDWTRKKLMRALNDAGFRPAYHNLKEALATPRVLNEGEFVIVAGGDGSIRKAALKFLGRGLALAPLPLGTANNIARSLGLTDDIEDIIAGWKHPRHRRFDVGAVAGPWGRRRFVEGVGLGLISRAIAVLDDIDAISAHELKKVKHKLHRDTCVAAALAHEMPPLKTRLKLDERDMSDDFLVLEILNIRRAGPGLELAPKASPSDGLFDVVQVTGSHRARLMHALEKRLAEKGPARNLPTQRASYVRFAPATACQLRVDDGTLPLAAGANVEVVLEPGALDFIVPDSAR